MEQKELIKFLPSNPPMQSGFVSQAGAFCF